MNTQVIHCKTGRYDVYIGRPSRWGNPFYFHSGTNIRKIVGEIVSTREEAIGAYRDWILGKRKIDGLVPPTVEEIQTALKGKVLACWCKPLSCHGDILAEIADNG